MRSFQIRSDKGVCFRSSTGHAGVFAADVEGAEGNKQRISVICNTWPLPAEAIVSGLRFTAKLQPATSAKYPDQHAATDVQSDEPTMCLILTAIRDALPELGKDNLRRLCRLRSTLKEKLERVARAEDGLESLRVRPASAATRVVDLYEKIRPAIDVASRFPEIPLQTLMKYKPPLTVDVLEANPWAPAKKKPASVSAKDVLAISDLIGKRLGFPVHAVQRMEAYARAACRVLSRDTFVDGGPNPLVGSTWFPREEVVARMAGLQGFAPDFAFTDQHARACLADAPPFVSVDRDWIAMAEDAAVERRLAQRIRALNNMEPNRHALRVLVEFDDLVAAGCAPSADMCAKIPRCRSLFDKYRDLDETQRSALRALATHRVITLLGSAGTGKSRTLSVLVLFAHLVMKTNMRPVAYTGKAVHRLRQEMDDGIECCTMHAQMTLAEFNNELDVADSFAIDEASMASPSLVTRMLEVSRGCSYLVFCGDDRQLPSFDPGAMLRDVVQSGVVATVRLTTIYRCGPGSGIATETPKIFLPGDQFPRESCSVNGLRIDLCAPNSDARLGAAIEAFRAEADEHGPDNVQVLSNTKRQCDRVNLLLQTTYNPELHEVGAELLHRGPAKAPYCKGDRVINTENMNTLQGRIFNGQIGTIASVDARSKQVHVAFDDVTHTFGAGEGDVNQLEHAWCVTVWKYQGSESSAVISLLDSGWGLSCELVNTAITRGKLSSHLIMSRENLAAALHKRASESRSTRLVQRLEEERDA